LAVLQEEVLQGLFKQTTGVETTVKEVVSQLRGLQKLVVVNCGTSSQFPVDGLQT
jgi:hypothetical protein